MEKIRKAYRNSVRKSIGRLSLERPVRISEDNIKINVWEKCSER
jgi:hypothetical protein